MRKLHQKLNSSRGASFLLAMVLFLIAAMVSVVLASVTVTAAKRVYNDRLRQQENLTLQSAARLLEQSMRESSCAVTTGERYATPLYASDGVLGAEMLDAIQQLRTISVLDETGDYTVTVAPTVEDETIQPVRFRFCVARDEDTEEQYQVTGTLRLAENGINLYTLRAQLVGTPEQSSDTVPVPQLDSEGNPIIDDEGNPVVDEITVPKTVTTFRWESVEFRSIQNTEVSTLP